MSVVDDRYWRTLFERLRVPVRPEFKQAVLMRALNAEREDTVELADVDVAFTRRAQRRVVVGALAVAILLLGSLGVAATRLWSPGPDEDRIGPRYQLATGSAEGHTWKLTAYRSKSGTCVDLAGSVQVGGPGSCWSDVPSQRALGEVRASTGPWPGGEDVFLWAPVVSSVAAVRIEFGDGSFASAELVEDPDGFGVSFFWAVTDRTDPIAVVALDARGVQLARESVTTAGAPMPNPEFIPPSPS